MRFMVLTAALLMSACQASQPHPYPDSARADFLALCKMGEKPCACAWTAITTSMTHADYDAALKTMDVKGTMDPRIVQASLQCRP